MVGTVLAGEGWIDFVALLMIATHFQREIGSRSFLFHQLNWVLVQLLIILLLCSVRARENHRVISSQVAYVIRGLEGSYSSCATKNESSK